MRLAPLIPSAVILTLLLMSVSGIGLNQVTLASLISALGMLVDNAIVMSESIMVKMENGQEGYEATGTLKIEHLETINIYAQQSGNNVSLKKVADIKVAWQPTKS